MASQRQIQDNRESTQEDSLGIEDARQVTIHKVEHQPKRAGRPPKLATPDPLTNLETVQKLESLAQLLKGEISAIDPDAALKTIDELYNLVQKAKQPEAKEIATGLKELQKLLKQKEPNGHELGELIVHLGEQTTQIADLQSEVAFKTPLQHLGKQLSKFGRSLSKSGDLEHLEGLDAIVDILEQKPKKIDLKHAITTIDLWYEILHKSEDSSLKEIAIELKDLKQLLKSDRLESRVDFSHKIIKIGNLTTAVAATAGRGFKSVIQKLGKVLTTFGKSLA
jgi:hypothetical protein